MGFFTFYTRLSRRDINIRRLDLAEALYSSLEVIRYVVWIRDFIKDLILANCLGSSVDWVERSTNSATNRVRSRT